MLNTFGLAQKAMDNPTCFFDRWGETPFLHILLIPFFQQLYGSETGGKRYTYPP